MLTKAYFVRVEVVVEEGPRLAKLNGTHFEQLVLQERVLYGHSPEEAVEVELEALLAQEKSRIGMDRNHRRLEHSNLFVVWVAGEAQVLKALKEQVVILELEMALARFGVMEEAAVLMAARDLKKVEVGFEKGEIGLSSTQYSSLTVFEMWAVGVVVSCQSAEALLALNVQHLEVTVSSLGVGCSLAQQRRVSEVLLLAAQAEQPQALEEERHSVEQVLARMGASSWSRDPNRTSSLLLHSSVTLACPVRIGLPIAAHCPYHCLLQQL